MLTNRNVFLNIEFFLDPVQFLRYFDLCFTGYLLIKTFLEPL